jgi:spermidine synthase
MAVPRWQQWLSYLMEIHVESAPSAVNPHLYVSLKKGRYQLSTANAIYSYEDLYVNFEQAFLKLDIKKQDIDQVLVLGFGLGSIPYMLEHKFQRDYQYTGVELDESVIYLAGKYALPKLTSSVSLICADAVAFVAQTEALYALICVDIFLDDMIPDHARTLDFLEDIRARLAPGGIVLFNQLGLTEPDKAKAKAFYQEIFLKAFPEGEYWQLGGNVMLVSL